MVQHYVADAVWRYVFATSSRMATEMQIMIFGPLGKEQRVRLLHHIPTLKIIACWGEIEI